LSNQFGGLRRYLSEIDPQFDDERRLLKEAFDEEGSLFAGKEYLDLTKRKVSEGRRTLDSPY
jgi:hypothetical protein